MIKVNKKNIIWFILNTLKIYIGKNFYLKKKFGSYKPRNKLEKNILENTKIRFIEVNNI